MPPYKNKNRNYFSILWTVLRYMAVFKTYLVQSTRKPERDFYFGQLKYDL